MSSKKRNKSTGRDYSYDTAYESSPEQKKKRAARNKARAEMEKKGLVHKGDGKDVDHADSNPLHNVPSNWRVQTEADNRSRHAPDRPSRRVRPRK